MPPFHPPKKASKHAVKQQETPAPAPQEIGQRNSPASVPPTGYSFDNIPATDEKATAPTAVSEGPKRQDQVDRSFLGMGKDDQQEGDAVRKDEQKAPTREDDHEAAPQKAQKPTRREPKLELLPTGEDDMDAFNKLIALRGFDLVGDLQTGIRGLEQDIKALKEQKTQAEGAEERSKMEKDIAKKEFRLAKKRLQLKLISSLNLRDIAALENTKRKLETELEGADTNNRRKTNIKKQLATVQEQIDAVKHAHANPNDPVSLAALEGMDFGIPRKGPKLTYVIAQVQTADGEIHSFVAKNDGRGTHAEDFVIQQVKDQVKDLNGAKMILFGDQEVCARCQKRLPAFAEASGMRSIEGYTVHAPALNRDGDVRAKTTIMGATNPVTVGKREQRQQKANAAGNPQPLKLKQKQTFNWTSKNPPGPAAPKKTTPTAARKPSPKAKTTPAASTSRKPGLAPAATNKLNKADMLASAIRDFQIYKSTLLKEGMSESEATTRAAARAGVTLGANMKGGAAANIVNGINAFLNAEQSGQGKGEATATAFGSVVGGQIANKVAPTGPIGAVVQLANTTAQIAGAPQEVQDTTYGAAELIPANVVTTTLVAGARSWYNIGDAIVTGDTKGVENLGKEMESGGLGPWLQGYTQLTGMVANMAAGDGFNKALNRAAESGKGSWADRVGSGLGEAAYELGQNKEVLGGQYGPIATPAIALNFMAGLARGEDVSTAFAKTQEAVAAGQKQVNANVARKVKQVKNYAKVQVAKAKQSVATSAQQAKVAIEEQVSSAKALAEDTFTAVSEGFDEAKTSAVQKMDQMSDAVEEVASQTLSTAQEKLAAGEEMLKNKAAEAADLAKKYLPGFLQ